jgi:hypothetical protein
VPFLAYVHASDPRDPAPDRPPWQPNWHVWRWIAAAAVVGYAATRAGGGVESLLALIVFGLCCQAVHEALPYGDGLREWRQ